MDPKVYILLGAARSGTTFLGRSALSNVEGLCYLGEPNHIWMHGHAYNKDDILNAEDVSDENIRYIRRQFFDKMEAAGASAILEKTPSNCLRLPFILKVFPEAKFIHLVRDGRGVVNSAVKEWRGDGKDAHDSKELRQGNSLSRVGKGMAAYVRFFERIKSLRDVIELPAYLPRFSKFVLRNVTSKSDYSWGPRFPGMKRFRKEHSLYETCAEQWRWQIDSVQEHRHLIADEAFHEMRFEELMNDPKNQLMSLLSWMGLTMDEGRLDSIADSVQRKPSSSAKNPRSGLDEADCDAIEAIIRPTLDRLGYE